MSSAVLAVIIGSLCFSVGEGLRLTPFPVSSILENGKTNGVVVKASEKISFSQYGPLDVPAQPQKRSKRQGFDVAVPGTASAQLVVTSFCYLFQYDAVPPGSVLFIPRPEGRAPPSFS